MSKIFSRLPVEVWRQVLEHTDLNSSLALRATNKELYSIVESSPAVIDCVKNRLMSELAKPPLELAEREARRFCHLMHSASNAEAKVSQVITTTKNVRQENVKLFQSLLDRYRPKAYPCQIRNSVNLMNGERGELAMCVAMSAIKWLACSQDYSMLWALQLAVGTSLFIVHQRIPDLNHFLSTRPAILRCVRPAAIALVLHCIAAINRQNSESATTAAVKLGIAFALLATRTLQAYETMLVGVPAFMGMVVGQMSPEVVAFVARNMPVARSKLLSEVAGQAHIALPADAQLANR